MKFLIVLALICLSAFSIWAEDITEDAESEAEVKLLELSNLKEGNCTMDCALKLLLFHGNGFGTGFLKLLVDYEDESVIDKAISTCDQQVAGDSDDSCDKYFDCISEEFQRNNVTFLFDIRA